jgi:hypothetical protein
VSDKKTFQFFSDTAEDSKKTGTDQTPSLPNLKLAEMEIFLKRIVAKKRLKGS